MSISTTLEVPPSSSLFINDKTKFEVNACSTESNYFNDLTFLKTLSTAKFPVYLAYSKTSSKKYALKIFSTKGEKSILYFLNEIRFARLQHPYIVRILHFEQDKVLPVCPVKTPCIVMEYAPYGDLFDFIQRFKTNIDEKLIRTYFRQLVDGVEYLHSNSIAHLDLKLDNLLIGENYILKIADFDLSYITGDKKVYSKGTKYYRPPEVIENKCKNYWASDIYAIGVILFTLKTRGMFPHAENKTVMGVNLFEMLYTENQRFWKKHEKILGVDSSFFEKDFRDLFNALVQLNPEMRPSIKDVKKSNWYNGPYYSQQELEIRCRKLYGY